MVKRHHQLCLARQRSAFGQPRKGVRCHGYPGTAETGKRGRSINQPHGSPFSVPCTGAVRPSRQQSRNSPYAEHFHVCTYKDAQRLEVIGQCRLKSGTSDWAAIWRHTLTARYHVPVQLEMLPCVGVGSVKSSIFNLQLISGSLSDMKHAFETG